MKYIITILLFTALLAQTFSRSFAMADYLVNMESYKKACINKARPKMHCNGKCQMLKKLKKQEENDGTNLPTSKFNHFEEVLSSNSFFPSIEMILLEKLETFHSYSADPTSNYSGAIFHPPSV